MENDEIKKVSEELESLLDGYDWDVKTEDDEDQDSDKGRDLTDQDAGEIWEEEERPVVRLGRSRKRQKGDWLLKPAAAMDEYFRPSDGLWAAFCVPIVIMIIIFIQRGIFPFGEESFLRTDMYHQYAPFFRSFSTN